MSNTLFKKVTAGAAALSIVLSILSPVAGVKAADTSLEAANRLAEMGIIADNSKDPSKYNLGSNITRREMLKIMMNLSGQEVSDSCEGSFSDLKSSDWGCKYAEAALKAGFIAKNDKFRPNDLVSKSEALKMIMQAKGITKKEGVDPWQKAYVEAGLEAGVITESFSDYTAAAKRSMVVVTADQAVSSSDDSSDDMDLGGLFGDDTTNGSGTTASGTTSTGTTIDNTTTTTVVKSGDLEISLNPASPANGSAIPMAGIVNFAKVDFTAGSSDISINSVEIKKASLSQVSSSTKIWFEKNGKRVSSRTSFTSEGNAIISFAPSYIVKAGSTETLDMLVELSDTSGGTDYTFKSGEVNSSAANFKGVFSTNSLRTSNYTVTNFKLETTSSNATYNTNGDEVYELGAFKLTSSKPTTVTETRELQFKTVTLYQSGSANLTNLKDVVLVRNGVVVSSGATIDGKTVTIQLSDTIKDGATAIYYVKAKVAYVEKTSDTYQLYTKNSSDIVVDEISSGIRSKAVTNYETLVSNLYTVKGSDVSFTRDETVALSSTVAPGSSNVVLLQGYIDSKTAVNLENPRLTYSVTGLGTSALSDYFSTMYLVIGNSSLSSSVSTTTGATVGTGSFDGTVTVNGKTPVKIYANLKSGTNLNEITFKLNELKLTSFSGRNEYVNNQETVSSAIGSISGINLSVASSTLSVTRNDGKGDTTMASGLKGVTMFGSKFTSTQGNPVRVTSLTFGFTGSTSDFVNNAYATLYINGTAVKSKTIDGYTVKFDGFNFDVSTSKEVNAVLKADFVDSFSSGTIRATLKTIEATDTVSSTNLDKNPNLDGALFTVNDATATFAVATDTPKNQLLTAGTTSNKLFAFRLTAKNDNLNVKEVVLTGSNLDMFTNFTLKTAAGTPVSASSASGTEVKFTNISSDTVKVNQDSTSDLYVYADAKTNTNMSGAVLSLAKTIIRGTNGKEITLTGMTVASNLSDVYENTVKIAQVSPVSKNIATDALRFSLTANGKNSITLNNISLSGTVSGYTGSYTIEVRKVNGDELVASTGATLDANGLTFSFGNNVVVDSGKTETYYVKLSGIAINSGSQQSDWSIKLANVNVTPASGHNYNLNRYADNATTLPMTSTK